MATSSIAFVLVALVVAINGQMTFPSMMNGAMNGMGMNGMGMNGMAGMMNGMAGMNGMTSPTMALQGQQLWQQFFFYRIMFGDAAARLIMADRMANMMGGNMLTRYYAGEYFDTPDAWWLTSSLMNRNNMQNMATNTNALPASGTTGTSGSASTSMGAGSGSM